MDFLQSKTYQNLLTAYESELMSSARYSIYGDIARQMDIMKLVMSLIQQPETKRSMPEFG